MEQIQLANHLGRKSGTSVSEWESGEYRSTTTLDVSIKKTASYHIDGQIFIYYIPGVMDAVENFILGTYDLA